MSPPEVKLKAGSPGRCPFRRQHPIGPYILDFYASGARLCVEIDGYSLGAGDREQHDERRDAWLALSHIEVLRIAASDVLRDPGAVAEHLLRLVWDRSAPPPPSASRPPPSQAGEDG